MKLKKVIDFILFSNTWISIGAVSCAASAFIFYQKPIAIEFLALVFCATFFGYNLQQSSYDEIFDDRKNQSLWISNYGKVTQKLAYIILIISIILVVKIFSWENILYTIPAFVLVLFYREKRKNTFSFRSIPFFKLFVIALVWTWTCAILPQLIYFNKVGLYYPTIIFLYIISITIPFDKRDLSYDSKKLKTLPQLIGIKSAYLTSFIIISFLLIIAMYFKRNLFCIYLIITILVLIPSYKIRGEYYYLFILDGLLLLFPIFAK